MCYLNFDHSFFQFYSSTVYHNYFLIIKTNDSNILETLVFTKTQFDKSPNSLICISFLFEYYLENYLLFRQFLQHFCKSEHICSFTFSMSYFHFQVMAHFIIYYLNIFPYKWPKAVIWRCSVKNFTKVKRKYLYRSLFFNKVAGFQSAILLKTNSGAGVSM